MNKYDEVTTIKEFPELTRKAAQEGMVLLRNENHCLPLKEGEKVALFGRCQLDFYKSGTGSGGAVNVLYKVNAVDGLLGNGSITLNSKLLERYKTFVKQNPFDNGGGGWAQEPWFQKECVLEDEFVKDIANESDKAVIIIGRTAGEDKDNVALPGGYFLTEEELQMINQVTSHFDHVVVVLNVANIIDMNWLRNYDRKINSVLYAWQGGMEGGNALADVLCGIVSPSGKLSGTIAKSIDDYPSSSNFGNETENFYQEDIYVGYRYFETFKQEAVLYPFGFGLSYTTFDIELTNVSGEDDMTYTFTVKNTGTYPGKEVVQLYVSAPQGKLGKPKYELCQFAKTKELQPNEQETITITVSRNALASYDDGGYTGYRSAYVLEPGTYRLFYGNHVQNLRLAFEFELNKLFVVEQLSEAMAPVQSFNRLKPGMLLENGMYELTYQEVPTRTVDLEQRIQNNLPVDIPFTGNKGISLHDVRDQLHTLEEFVAQLTVEEMIIMVRGEGMSHPLVTPGTAAAFGGLYEELMTYGIPATCAADGPSGLRMDSGHKATQMPIGTLLACTWNTPLMKELYTLEGRELLLNNVDTLLGPGMNIHRHPLCGRNFEYFSEDPYITGRFASAATLGMHEGGSSGTLKHFAANDQEKQRHHIDAVASERCLREIHLKGFEMAVKEGKAISIMTAYNPINGIQAASNYDMNTTILRNEWGYQGFVMTDWWAIMNHNVNGGTSSRQYASYMIRAQNDLYMVVVNYGAKHNFLNDDLHEAITTGSLTVGELQRSVMNILRFIIQAPVMDREMKTIPVISVPSMKTCDHQATVITTEIKHNTKVNNEVYLEVLERGVYSIAVDMRYDANDLAQSACNITMNDTYIYNVQMNGNGNAWTKEYVINVDLEVGYYHFVLDFTKPGLEVGTISFIKL